MGRPMTTPGRQIDHPPPQTPTPRRRTRLAPSPTGALHLGNARSFVIAWLIARKLSWNITLRIEDLDGPRIKPGAAEAIADTLTWLGLNWDGPVLIQSSDLTPYRRALEALAASALAFPSDLSRAQVEDTAASAPQEGAHEVRFGPELRPPLVPRAVDDTPVNWRLAVAPGPVTFTDRAARPALQTIDVSQTAGDFIIWTKRGVPAYQLAVVVDDHRQGITDVIRGSDLIDSAARQRLLYRALGLTPEPDYWHLALVVGPDGRRLAKRHGDTRVETYRQRGVPAEAIIGWVAHSAGINPHLEPMSLKDVLALWPTDWPGERGEPARITFTPEVDRWLMSFAKG